MSVTAENPARVATCCRKGGSFQGPKVGSGLTLGNELRRQVLTKQEALWGRGARGEPEGQGSQEDYSASWLAVLAFTGMGLVSRLSLAYRSDSGSFLVAQPCSAKMDASETDSERWLDMCHFLTFPELFQLVVAYYFPVPH